MTDGQLPKRKLWDRLQDTYRISILDDENLEEVGSYNLSLLSFYTLLSVAAISLAALVIAFIVFTPVRRLIPGYGDISDNKRFIELSKRVDELETEISAYDTYTTGLKAMLTTGNQSPSVKNDSTNRSKPELVNQNDVIETRQTMGLNFLKFATPVKGNIAAKFQPNIRHFGIDILAAKDTPIKAIMDGIVISAEQLTSSGNSIYIQHANNLVSVYKHNSSMLVKTGDFIKTGQAIAIIGNTGEQTTGPHLHFELWYDGKFVNPSNYIAFN